MVDHLEWVIKEYWKEGWYGTGFYAIETGGDGNMLHAHCMFRIDNSPKGMKSVTGVPGVKKSRGHLGKGNHKNQLQKYWNKVKAYQGALKGARSIQLIRCNNNAMVLDKQDYLVEEKKPQGHTNVDLKGIKGINQRFELG
jgi:hypothetical protein